MSTSILYSKDLTFQYPNANHILNFKDIHIAKGQHTLLLGDSGTGKTTLLHLLCGLSTPTTGKVFINDQDLYSLNESSLDSFRAAHLGFIFQDAHLLKNLNIIENIQLAQYLAKKPIHKEEIFSILEKLQLQDKSNSLPRELSRGQLQRVAIARAVINKPQLLLADEPTASLDDRNTQHVLELLIETASLYQATLLISTHDKRIKDHFSNTYQL